MAAMQMSAPAISQSAMSGAAGRGSWLLRNEIQDQSKLIFGSKKDQKGALMVHQNSAINQAVVAIGTNMAARESVQKAFLKAYNEEMPKAVKEQLTKLLSSGVELLKKKESKTEELLNKADQASNVAENIQECIQELEDAAKEQEKLNAEGKKSSLMKLSDHLSQIPKVLMSMLDRWISALWPQDATDSESVESPPASLNSPYLLAVNVASLILTLGLIRKFIATQGVGVEQFGGSVQDIFALRFEAQTGRKLRKRMGSEQ